MKRDERDELKLWYRQPAAGWTEALPIGNGRLGGMVFGKVKEELVSLNEDTVWYGGPQERNNPDAAEHMVEIRRLLFEGQVSEAQYLAKMALTSIPKYFGPYQPLGDLHFTFAGHDGDVRDYRRELDLDTGVVTVSYTMDGVPHKRELFCSEPDQVMAIRLTCDRPKSITVNAHLMRRPFDGGSAAIGGSGSRIAMSGVCGPDGVKYCVMLEAVAEDGGVKTVGDFVSVEQATSVTFILAAGTTFRYGNPREACERIAAQAGAKTYERLKQAHIADYRELLGRVKLHLSGADESEVRLLPTDERLKRLQSGEEDRGLIALYFHFGRYLLLSCSRPGSMAANLRSGRAGGIRRGCRSASFTSNWRVGCTSI
ncbi:glycoside hydrolase family 95 protein [Paenibacillus alkalitolerans]|uniref:glycoside hydrolase family 95 protein n=1 Tax=Paenibacillus alkalitolerans TaxID=2799335 RepID=UPI0018F5DE37|nr:glycoside hydrolase family 95 protein [Paenibacillus alkalitolerans]